MSNGQWWIRAEVTGHDCELPPQYEWEAAGVGSAWECGLCGSLYQLQNNHMVKPVTWNEFRGSFDVIGKD